MKTAKQVSGRWLVVFCAASLVVALVFVGLTFQVLAPSTTGTMYGTLFVNEGGQPMAADPTASYNATLTVQNGAGTVLLTFLSGQDLVPNHLIPISNYSIDTNKITMTVKGAAVVLPWEDNDTIWNHLYDNNYIGSQGPLANLNETRGVISPSLFGLPSHDYVEFRFEAQGGNPTGSSM